MKNKMRKEISMISSKYEDAKHNQIKAEYAIKKHLQGDRKILSTAPRLGDDCLPIIKKKNVKEIKESLYLRGIRLMSQNLLHDLHDMLPNGFSRLNEYEHMERIFTRTARVMRGKESVELACKAMFILNRDIFNLETIYSLVDVINDKYLLGEIKEDAEWAYYILKMIEIRASIEELVTLI